MYSLLGLSFLPKYPVTSFFLAIFLLFFGIYIRSSPRKNSDNQQHNHHGFSTPSPKTQSTSEPDSYPPITPLPPSFNWETTNPIALRPFKPKYHLTMAISNLDPSDLVPMDKTYLARLALRRDLLKQYPDVVRAVNLQESDSEMNSKIKQALYEWYGFVMGVYLPTRYGSMFRLQEEDGMKMIKSLVTGLKIPVQASELVRLYHASSEKEKKEATNLEQEKSSLLHILDTMASWIDEDFLILLPSALPSQSPQSQEQDPKYHLQAYTTYYPAGFDTRTKLSLPLSAIHTPVPGYKEKLEKSMDRFFSKLEVGRFVVRTNWSIMTAGTGLFAAFGGLHDHNPGPASTSTSSFSFASVGEESEGRTREEEEEEEEKIPVESFTGEDTYLRVERQTLHRLPKSKALIFAFHTYTYPLSDIKKEGLGEDLAVAIDGLKGGNVPEIYPYKRGPYWGEAVKAFLRS
ncbi:hypothetical protein BJY04DRAFT_35901 [Aspergillus karnatakaensis]|uniref:heme-dependent oxidative N-demethylase family protein n=1 Tax=Aspergillus karnatakaensis TaxID=1810916 RepID=UPI003CCD08E2